MYQKVILFSLFFVLCEPGISQCEIAFNGLNQEGKATLKLEDKLFFTHTDEQLEEYIGEREFVSTTAGLLQIEKEVYLNLSLTLATAKAEDYYGSLVIGQPIKIQLLDRGPLFLDIVHTELPEKDGKKGITTYNILAKLDKSDQKALRKCELDYIGFVWSSGYEEYEIYDIDFLKKQFECLKKHN